MKTKMVSYTWDELPPLTEESIARLKAVFDRPESETDLTDPTRRNCHPKLGQTPCVAATTARSRSK